MADTELEARLRREKGKAVVRALHEAALEDAGAERIRALDRAEQQLDRIARLLPDALEAGLGMTEIARLTSVSRPTLYELRGRYSDSPRDLRLAVMTALLSPDSAFPGELPLHLGRPAEEIQPVLEEFHNRGWIEWEPEGGRPIGYDDHLNDARITVGNQVDFEYPYAVTPEGYEALEAWRLADEGDRS